VDNNTDDLAIDVCDLTYAYPGGPPVLHGISFQIHRGESVGLVGPNGAGKTSLFLCLAGVLPGRAKVLRLGGLDLSQGGRGSRQAARELAGQVGIVFQNSDDQLFSTTVFDDVAFGPLNLGLPADEVRRRVADALAQVGLVGLEQRTPLHLSGGEKRRVALAGVLAMHPQVLLLDEPSIFLDPRGRRELLRLLQELGGTRIVAAHDLELILQTCGRVVVLDAGRIVANGPARALLADRALMEAHGLEVPASLGRMKDEG